MHACVYTHVQEWDCQGNTKLAKEYQVSWDDLDELETEKVRSARSSCKDTHNRDEGLPTLQ